MRSKEQTEEEGGFDAEVEVRTTTTCDLDNLIFHTIPSDDSLITSVSSCYFLEQHNYSHTSFFRTLFSGPEIQWEVNFDFLETHHIVLSKFNILLLFI